MEEKLGREIDAIVAPVAATAAVRHDQFMYYGYASVINLLDFTTVVVPVLFADKGVDGRKEGYEGLNEVDGMVQAECKFYLFLYWEKIKGGGYKSSLLICE